jgi:hypothetical protein
MFNFTQNEKLAALHLVNECLDGMGGERPIHLEDDKYTWTHVQVLTDNGWSKHEASGTYGALAEKNALYIETRYLNDDGAWKDTISDDLYRWAESHWDEFVVNGKPSK